MVVDSYNFAQSYYEDKQKYLWCEITFGVSIGLITVLIPWLCISFAVTSEFQKIGLDCHFERRRSEIRAI